MRNLLYQTIVSVKVTVSIIKKELFYYVIKPRYLNPNKHKKSPEKANIKNNNKNNMTKNYFYNSQFQ